MARFQLHPTIQEDFGEDDPLAIAWCLAPTRCSQCNGYIDAGLYMVWERANMRSFDDEADSRDLAKSFGVYPQDSDGHVFIPHCIHCALNMEWVLEGP